MKAVNTETYSRRIEEYNFELSKINYIGLAILGQIACVAAGALNGANDILIRYFFPSVMLSTIPYVLGRFSYENYIYTIKVNADRGFIKLDDQIRGIDSAFLPSYRFYVEASVIAVLVPAMILVFGIWSSEMPQLVSDVKMNIRTLIFGPLTAFAPYAIFKSFLWGRTRFNYSKDDLSKSAERALDASMFSQCNVTCSRLLLKSELYASRSQVIVISLAAQVTCVGAGALSASSSAFLIAFFTSVLISAFILSGFRFVWEDARLLIRRDIKSGTIIPQSRTKSEYHPDMFLGNEWLFVSAGLVPPLILLIGSISPIYKMSEDTAWQYTTLLLGVSAIQVGVVAIGVVRIIATKISLR